MKSKLQFIYLLLTCRRKTSADITIYHKVIKTQSKMFYNRKLYVSYVYVNLYF